MARETSGFDTWKRPSHDGALRCALCAANRTEADHEWCVAAECIVCDDCCTSLLRGEPSRVFSISANTGRILTPEELFQACARCERAHRHAREHLLADLADEDAPAC